jgi:glycine/D-amino acid oxidase-like deaminating enzyme
MTTGRAIWRDQLTAGERAALGRGAGVIPEPRPDVLVVGGGIVGAATAVACYEAGLGSVLLIEAGQLGSGATGGAAGLLTPEIREWSDPGPFTDLARASLGHWKDLELSRPGGVGLMHLDWIGLVPDPESFALHQPPAVEWLMPERVRDFVPGLAAPMAGALIRHQARVNPLRALARLTAALPDVATGRPAARRPIRPGEGTSPGNAADLGAAARHGGARRHPVGGWAAAGWRHLRYGR